MEIGWAGGRSPQAGDGDTDCGRELAGPKQTPSLQISESVPGSQNLFLGKLTCSDWR